MATPSASLHLADSATRSALRAKSPENYLAFANNSFAEGLRRGLRHLIPLNVLDIATKVADEVVMPRAFRIESRGAALNGYFAHEIRLHQVPQNVISSGPGTAGIHAIHSFENFRSRGVPVVFHQERHHSVALRSTAQSARVKKPLNRLGIHQVFRLYLM